MAKKSPLPPGARLEKWKEAAGLAMLLGALFVLVSLITWDAADLGYGAYPANPSVVNKGGKLGAALAEFLYRYLGLASFAAVAIGGAWGTAIFFRQSVHALVLKFMAAVLAVYAASVFLALQPLVTPADVGLASAMPTLGGAYGDVGRRVLEGFLGAWGTLLAVLFAVGAAAMLATPWRPHRLLLGAWRLACATTRWTGSVAWPTATTFAGSCFRMRTAAQTAGPEAGAAREAVAHGVQRPPVEAPLRRAETAPAAPGATARAEETRHAPHPTGIPSPPPGPGTYPPARLRAAPVEAAAKAASPREPEPRLMGDFTLPPVGLFEDIQQRNPLAEEIDTQGTSEAIEKTLGQFNIPARVTGCRRGPIITEYYVEPAPGIKVSRIFGMHDELAIALRTPSVRIVGPIPGKGALGVEVPNPCPEIVRMRSLLEHGADAWQRMPLPLFLGKDAAGTPIVKSLADLPHLLVAGTTGSGKSVCLNAVITSLLVSMSPARLKLLLVDPKMVELSPYKGIPHLWAPVMTDMKREVPTVLEWLCREMDERFDLLSAVEVKNIEGFNGLTPEEMREGLAGSGRPIPDPLPDRLPYIVLVIDEFAELMNVASKEVLFFVQRLAQKARAVGIHVVIATQHPSTDVVAPEIKANFPARIAFQVSSQVNSRVVLDRNGAERLLGHGDMLALFPGMAEPIRGQGTYLQEKEVLAVADFLRRQGSPSYHAELLDATRPEQNGDDEPISDKLYEDAVRVVLGHQRGSVSLLQRRLGIGYSRAARLVDLMAERGVVGAYQGSKAREVLLTLEQWEGLKEPVGQA